MRFRAGCGGKGGVLLGVGDCNATESVADGDFGWIAIPGGGGEDLDETRFEQLSRTRTWFRLVFGTFVQCEGFVEYYICRYRVLIC